MKPAKKQRLRTLAVVSAALIPASVISLQATHVPDMAKGLLVGALIGLSVLALIRAQTCAD